MVLDRYRAMGEQCLIPVTNYVNRYHPNTLTWLSLVFALFAGVSLYFASDFTFRSVLFDGRELRYLLLVATIFIMICGGLDALDGKVARITGRVSRRGDFLDHAIDRYADIFIFGGIILSPYCDLTLGFLAIIAIMLTSYMGTQAQAMGCGRDYSGLLGRADRVVIVIFAPLVQLLVHYIYVDGRLPWLLNMSIFELMMIWFIIAGNFTAIHRGIHIWTELGEKC